ncbi:RNA-binding protein CP33, chloroplastic [Ananas comosus]|uniref:RNA-binding protein CP33, chloroplastic n=1 Tax=Ananas comosus TaxID=4615 RepID=A0A199UG91_ANACO|nr:RNA-binding protein CP33, chloroplastic [Ananas comosus]
MPVLRSENPPVRKLLSIDANLLSLFPLLPSPPRLLPLFASSSAAYSEEDGAGDELGDEGDELFSELKSPPATHESGRLYVGNLPFSMTSAQLAEIFGEAGTVDTVEVIYDRVTDRSRGFAFVTMATVEEANEAIRMFDGSQVGGRTVKVNFPEVPRGGEREVMGPKIRSGARGFIDSPHKVYAGNLGWSLTSQALREAFSSQPGLLGAKIIFDRDMGRSRGFGFVSFASAEEAQAAIEAMNGVEVEGRPLRLSPAAGRPPASPSPESATQAEVEEGVLQSSPSY